MSIDIDKLSQSSYVPYELAEINRLSSQKISVDEKSVSSSKRQDKGSSGKEPKIDTYKSSVVSDSIEKQIHEQEEKIREINENLAVLRENYSETGDAEDAARSVRYQKESDLRLKRLSENSLKRIFANWTKKYKTNEDDESILKEYNLSSSNFDDATVERILADNEYKIADSDAYAAISAHNYSSSELLSGLWGKRDASWDLAKMQQRLGLAKMAEGRHFLA